MLRSTYKVIFLLVSLQMAGTVIFPLQAAAETARSTVEYDRSIWPRVQSDIPKNKKLEKRIQKILKTMSLKEKVGQMVQPQITNVSPDEIKKYQLGTVLSAGGSYPAKRHSDTISWVGAAEKFYNASVKGKNDSDRIPYIWGVDAIHGHNNLTGATVFPHNIGLGATQNVSLLRLVGEVTAREVAVSGLDWAFAPTVAVARDRHWGRSYESYSENPELVAKLGAAMIVGLQGHPSRGDFFAADKVIATAKHFIGDGGTERGDDQGNTVLSEKELYEIHGQGYVTAIQAGVQTIMASFNSWNGKNAHGHHYLLTTVLKEQMGFDGFVVGDWNGHEFIPGCTPKNCVEVINAGVDVVMVPDAWREFYANTVKAVKKGKITEARIDDAVTRILRVKARAGVLDGVKPSKRKFSGRTSIVGHPKHRAVARQSVRESLVLLKNNNQTLPIDPSQRILITGSGAKSLVMQHGGWTMTWQGDKTSNDDFKGATSIYEGIRQQVELAEGSLEYSADGEFSQNNKPNVAIVVFGEKPYAEMKGDLEGDVTFSSNELDILSKLKDAGIPVLSIFLTGRPRWVNPQINRSDAFVSAWLPGSEGQGIADVILANKEGSVQYDFKGKLPFSWPKQPDQAAMNKGDENYDPLFSYGYGLTYQDKSLVDILTE